MDGQRLQNGTLKRLRASHRGQAIVLFGVLLAGQSSFLALVSTMPEIASEFELSPGIAGQLATATGLAGVAAATGASLRGSRAGAIGLLRIGLSSLAAASVAMTLAGTAVFVAFACAAVGAASAIVAVGATTAAFTWPRPEMRSRVVALALLGQPVAWVIGSPIVGSLTELNWHVVWCAPAMLALVALLLAELGGRPCATTLTTRSRGALRQSRMYRWAAGEVFAYTGWNGTMIYMSALLTGRYGLSPWATGLSIGAIMSAYLPATIAAQRFVDRYATVMLRWLAPVAAVGILALGSLRPALPAAILLLALIGAISGARGLAGSVYGIGRSPGNELSVSALRVAIIQSAGMLGGALGGFSLSAAGWQGLGVALAATFLVSSIAHMPIPALLTGGDRFGSAAGKYGNSADGAATARP